LPNLSPTTRAGKHAVSSSMMLSGYVYEITILLRAKKSGGRIEKMVRFIERNVEIRDCRKANKKDSSKKKRLKISN